MKLARRTDKLTRARFLFRDRKRSCCFRFFRATMSFGNRRGCSRVSVT